MGRQKQAAAQARAETAAGQTHEGAADVLRVFGPVMKAIAAAGGPSVEVVLHDLEGEVDLEHTIVAIENGHVTGRAVGGPSTSLGLDVLKDRKKDHDAFGYTAYAGDGRQLRCSSTYFHNAAGDIIAALCINVDLSQLQQARRILDGFLPAPGSDALTEQFGDLTSVLESMITEAIGQIGRPAQQLSREDKIAVVQRLDEGGATQLRKSVEAIARRLGISRVTAYAYLDEARKRAD